jgi:phage/plasmid-like protein (TIGR03299 family)
MAHLIDSTTGTAAIAYAGDVPWHGLGQRIDADQPLEVWREMSVLNWDIEAAKVEFKDRVGGEHAMKGKKVLYRSDTNAPLSVVSERFCVVQPAEVLEFFRDLVDAGGFKLHTAGSLREGRTIWALAETGESACIVGNDKVDSYLLLSTACDGTMTTNAMFTSVRVVCANTLALARNSDAARVSVPHSTVFDHSKAKSQLGIATGTFATFIEEARYLSTVRLSDKDMQTVLGNVLIDQSYAHTNQMVSRPIDQTKGFKAIMDLFTGAGKGADLPGAQGTAWGLLNAVTEYSDRHVRARNQDARLNSSWFGAGAELKNAMRDALMAL